MPGYARGLLRAAREFQRSASGTQLRSGRLFSGAGITQGDLAKAARRLGLSLPGELDSVSSTSIGGRSMDWHCTSTAWWVGEPLHSPPAADPPATGDPTAWLRR